MALTHWLVGSTSLRYVPSPPPGLRVDAIFGPQAQEHDAREMWLGLVVLSAEMAQFDKDGRMDRIPVFSLPLSQDRLSPVRREHTTWYMLVWGLWALGSQISLKYVWPHQVPIFVAEIKGNAGALGAIIIKDSKSTDTVAQLNGSTTDLGATSRRRDSAILSTVGADQGSFVWGANPNLVIRYRFFPERLSPASTLQAFLSAQTYFSWYRQDMQLVDMQAFSVDRRVQIRVHDVKSGSRRQELTWSIARIGMTAVWCQLVMGYNTSTKSFTERQRFQSVSWTYLYKSGEIGHGSLGW
ncbi:MAG: hypothetical protein LQ352_005660 [Teloschistes flavicans]|nr:MAG: hypothetical protein LQ352_005660 [Teloschistes flavicans]